MKRKTFSIAAFCAALSALLILSACNKPSEPASEQNSESASESTAASSGVSGKIVLKGTPPPASNMSMDAACGKLHTTIPKTRLYVVGESGELADVFVHIKDGLTGKSFPPASPALLDQKGCEYVPYVLGLQTGQKLLVRNSDPMMHNVHPLPKVSGNKESNKAQMPKAPDLEYTFEKPEIFVTYKCDVHPWMYAYVAVVEHPFFAVSGKDGTFSLKDVPDGKYVLEAVHRKVGKQTKEITVTNGKSQPIEFTFELPASL